MAKNEIAQKFIPHVRARYLLLIAACIWMFAGGNVLIIGLLDFISSWQQHFVYVLAILFVFLLFVGLVFYKLVDKHHQRITSMGVKKVPVYHFFDGKSYIIMVVMISGGILLRKSHILPSIAIGVMYSGIGLALLTAGSMFLRKFVTTPASTHEKDA